MFKIIFRLAIVCLIHIVLFAAYPDTGKNGNLFLGISLFSWCALVIMLSTVLNKMSIIGKFLISLIMLVFYGIEIAVTAYLMPQSDKTLVYDKLISRQFPSISTFKRGLLRFGINMDNIANETENAIEQGKQKLQEEKAKAEKQAKEQTSEKANAASNSNKADMH